MRTVKIAELKNSLSRYLAYVREGGEILVLDRDTPIARVVPFTAGDSGGDSTTADDRRAAERLAEMERQGVITRGNPAAVREWLRAERPVALPAGSGSVVQALLDMRAEDAR